MTDVKTIENRISLIKKYLKILEEFQGYSREKIEEDITLKGALERYLYLAVQSAIDLADAVISYKDYRKPTTMSESFSVLNENKVINSQLTEELIKMVGFRNVMAHDYYKIDYDIVYNVLKNKLKDIKEFIKIVADKCV